MLVVIPSVARKERRREIDVLVKESSSAVYLCRRKRLSHDTGRISNVCVCSEKDAMREWWFVIRRRELFEEVSFRLGSVGPPSSPVQFRETLQY